MRSTLTLIILLFTIKVFSQVFTETDLGIIGINQGNVMWGDYDNDSDLDVFVFGGNGNFEYSSGLFRNDEGSFTQVFPDTFTGLVIGDSDWGDFDGDGDLDIVISGSVDSSPQGGRTEIYENEGDGFTQVFSDQINDFLGAAVNWGDYDNDGDLDLAIGGEEAANGSNNPRNLEIYENTGSGFEMVYQEINTGINLGSVDWGDYDGDGDLDLLVTGFSSANETFRNTAIIDNTPQGFLKNSSIDLVNVGSGSGAWGDYDNDGDLDILLCGNTFDNEVFQRETLIYENIDGSFQSVFENEIIGVEEGEALWGDFDGDGDLDIAVVGRTGDDSSDLIANIYENNGQEFMLKESLSRGFRIASMAWGDYENDGDLDLIVGGQDEERNTVTRLYLNESGTNEYAVNTPPDAPENLSESVDAELVELSWTSSADEQTSSSGLTYNLFLQSETDAIVASESLSSGYRKVVSPGNMGTRLSFSISLEPGTYSWQVQSIDNTFEGSTFSEERTFTVEAVLNVTNEYIVDDFLVFPNPFQNRIEFENSESTLPFGLRLYDFRGSLIYSSEHESLNGSSAVDLSFLDSGTYILEVISRKGIEKIKVIKK